MENDPVLLLHAASAGVVDAGRHARQQDRDAVKACQAVMQQQQHLLTSSLLQNLQHKQQPDIGAHSLQGKSTPVPVPQGLSRRSHKRVQFADESLDSEEFPLSVGSTPKRLCSFLESVQEANIKSLSQIKCSDDDAGASAVSLAMAAIQKQIRMLSYSNSEADVATAVTELCNLFQHVPEEQQELVCSSSGGIRALVVSTSSRSGNSCCKHTSVQLAAAKALGSLAAASEAYQGAISASGGVKLLVQLLSGVNHAAEVQEAAAAALVNLTIGGVGDGIAATVAAGGVRALVHLLQLPGCPPDVGLQAVRVLANVSMGPPQYRSALADGGAIPLLVKSLSSSSSSSGNSSLMEVQYTCVTTLDSLAVYSSANKKLITEAGGVQAVVSLLRHVSRSNGSADGEGGGGGAGRNQSLAAALQEACAGLLESLATRYPSNCLAIEAAGGIRLLQQLVRAAIAGASSGGLDAGLAAGVKEASISALKRLGAIVPQC